MTTATHAAPVRDLLLSVADNTRLTSSIHVLKLRAPEFAHVFGAGQFLEIKTSDGPAPLLRRPYSIHRVEGDCIEVMGKVVGIGTKQLYDARVGDRFQVLAPLGNTFGYDKDDFDTALLVSGGIGVAPMAMLEEELLKRGKTVINLIGARTAEDIMTRHLSNWSVATDDGTMGLKGTVVSLLARELPKLRGSHVRVFSCGPNRMLAALSAFCNELGIACEVSIESTMGCGIGICYGCPVRIRDARGAVRNELLCQYGSVLDAREVVWDE
jgi:dihydroorotate dehydrogenase electron transfer subunit